MVAVIIVGLFVLLAWEKAHRVLIAFGAVALLWVITYLTPYHLISFEASKAAIDLNVILLLAAMMAVVGVLKSTGVFEWAVGRLLDAAGGRPGRVMVLVAGFTGLFSAFADNVTTVVFVTPMAIGVARQLGVNPAAFLLPMVMAANIGGTATLIGDPPNIMIGSGANLSFMQFVLNLATPCLYMMLMLEVFAAWWFRGELRDTAGRTGTAGGAGLPARPDSPTPPAPDVANPTLLRWSLAITAAIFVGFVTHGITGMPASVPAAIGAALILVVQDVLYLREHRPSHSERVHGIIDIIEREIEWPTLAFFAFLFIAVGAAVQTGLIHTLADRLQWAITTGGEALNLSPAGTLLFACLLILWVSGMLSAVIDNIPFVAVAIPVVAQLTHALGNTTNVLWWALALGACLGGNGSAVGASANVTAIGLAERSGFRITFAEFSRFGASVAAMTLLISSAFLTAHVFLGSRPTVAWGLAGFAALLAVRWLVRRVRGRPPLHHGVTPT